MRPGNMNHSNPEIFVNDVNTHGVVEEPVGEWKQ